MVEGHRAYEGDIYGTVEQAATAGGADDGWYPRSGQVARQAAGRYSAIEGQHLSEGQATRGDAPAPDGDYLGHSHQQLHNVKVATSNEHSLIPNLELMKDGYEQLREAFLIARRNYRETEAEHDQVFRKIAPK